MKNLLNFTERQDNIRKVGTNPEVKIIVREDSGLTEFEPIIKYIFKLIQTMVMLEYLLNLEQFQNLIRK